MYMIQFQHLERVNGHTLVSDYHLLWEFLRCIDSIKENGYMFLDFHSVLLIISYQHRFHFESVHPLVKAFS